MIDFNQYSMQELIQLNRELVEHMRVRNQRDSQRSMERFQLNERVSFQANNGDIIEGIIIRFNQKSVTIKTSLNEWRVAPQYLSKVVISKSSNDEKLIPNKY